MTDPFCPDFSRIPMTDPPVYIGSMPEPGFSDQLEWRPAGIRVIVAMVTRIQYRIPEDVVLLQWPLYDVESPQSLPDPARFERFLNAVHDLAEGAGILFHCHAGMNRSALSAVWYLHYMVDADTEITSWIARVRQARGRHALSNRVFHDHLLGLAND